MARPRTERRRKALLVAAQRATRERHAEFDLLLNDIAEDVDCSRRQLQRVFAESGESFREFLLRTRMEHAYRLLSRKKDGLTVRAAARAVGYREASGLRQRFVSFYGHAPSMIQREPFDYDKLWRKVEGSQAAN